MKKGLMIKLQKLTVMITALGIAMNPISVYALTKDETVYGKLDATGKPTKVVVNDYLKDMDVTGELEDYSDLRNIVNLSGDESFSQKDNKLIWKSNGNDILYQGTTSKVLPVGMSIVYKLNGEEKNVNDMIGKSGNVEIIITYTNNELHRSESNGKKEDLYTPFVVTTATSIDGDNNKNVKCLNGKVVANGNSYIIAGLSAPGLYESLGVDALKGIDKVVISYETTKFELSSIYSVITPKILESDDLVIFTKMDKIYSSIDELQKNMDVLEESARTISSNLNKVSESTGLVYSSLNTVLTNVGDLKSGTASLDSGLKTLLENLKTARANLSSPEMEQKLTSMKELYNVDVAQIQNITEKNAQLKQAYDTYGLANITYEQILAMQNMELYNLKYTYENFYVSNEGMIQLLTTNAGAIDASLKAINTMTGSVDTMITTVNGYMEQLSAGATKIDNGVLQLQNGIGLLTSNVGTLNTGVSELATGANKFSIGMREYNQSGINKLTQIKNQAVNVQLKIQKLTKLSEEYQTFTTANEAFDNNVKFIYSVDSIRVKEDKKKTQDKQKDTVWDRMKNLFK